MNEAPDTRLTLATSVSGIWIDAVAVRIRRADGDVADGVEALAVFGRQAHHDRKVAVAAVFVEIAGGLAADGRLDGRVDVARREPVARGPGAVDVDPDRRLAERVEHGEVGDARHRLPSRP